MEKPGMVGNGARWVLRSALLVGLASVVTTVIYFTPVPDPYFMSCERPCHELDWPMICRVKLTLEVYQTLSSSCGRCPGNKTDCWNKHCVTADGYRRGILTANRQLPGPSIQVCENDILVVDVVNRVPGHGLALHWRGLPQKETPFMDGVPMLTQCPIPSYTTFQYKFRASRPGTHLWHAHGGAEMADGLAGSLIVRRAPNLEPHRALYDEDRSDHVIVLTEWTRGFALQRLLQDTEQPPTPDSLLINGRGQGDKNNVPRSEFTVSQGKRYRFRLAHGGVISACAIKFSIDQHVMKVIEIDGSPIKPRDVNSITLASGERVDFVLHTVQPIGSYDIKAESQCSTTSLRQTATLRYLEASASDAKSSQEPENSLTSENVPEAQARKEMIPETQLRTESETCGTPDDELLCLGELEALDPVDPALTKQRMEFNLELPFDFTSNTNSTLAERGRVPHVANLTFMFPPSPLVTQASDVPLDLLCHAESRPASCASQHGVCECVHQVDIPRGVSVQLTLQDLSRESNSGHVFHMHGHAFYVVREEGGSQEVSLSPAKDTVTVPPGGRATLRFIADNPGYWLLQDQHVGHSSRGLGVVLHVGGPWDLPATPPDFPRCGSWRGPDFFLA